MKKIIFTALFLIHAASAPSRAEEAHHEEAAAVGPEKGIVANGPLGFQLSPEATARFAFKTEPYVPSSVPCGSIVAVKDAKSVFRLREGWLKRVRVDVVAQRDGTCSIRTEGLRTGDRIVTTRTGFLRTAEVILEEGASHSH